MTFFDSLENIIINENSAVTIGSFDGLHLGHDQIFSDLKKIAKQKHLKSVVISFYPHPAEILVNKDVPLLTLPHEKRQLMEEKGIDYFIVMPFTKELSELGYVDFVQGILINKIQMKHLLVGYDHALGKNRQGTYNNLHKLSETLNFGIEKVEAVKLGLEVASSTLIRAFIESGQLKRANHFLGRSYNIIGRVEKGDARGRTLGFPTANIAVENHRKLLPKTGVYFVEVKHSGSNYFGMCNVGKNPTFSGKTKRVEVHIFDFSKSIYDDELCVSFLKFVREEEAFENVNALKNQLINDEAICRSLINKA